MAWVYILGTDSGKYYVGSTTNISERLRHHLGKYSPSTKGLRAREVLLKQEYATLSEARLVEMKIKNMKRRDYVEKMIRDGYIKVLPR